MQVTVVIKHMFHPDEFAADPSYKAELESDVTAECAKLGPVDKARERGYGMCAAACGTLRAALGSLSHARLGLGWERLEAAASSLNGVSFLAGELVGWELC